MATVKGDVHDIGKNIVGVVLQCNNYEVIDLGVMVPAAKILDTARELQVDIIGLSGLITPSLDEMCHVAAEMERQNFELPLLIGGATTSRVHTAVKIHPNYHKGQAVYVTDASRAVGVAQSLMSKEARGPYVETVREDYAQIAAAHARGQDDKKRLTLADARANGLKLDPAQPAAQRPQFLGTKVLENYPLEKLVPYIDWTPFFQTWELTGLSLLRRCSRPLRCILKHPPIPSPPRARGSRAHSSRTWSRIDSCTLGVVGRLERFEHPAADRLHLVDAHAAGGERRRADADARWGPSACAGRTGSCSC